MYIELRFSFKMGDDAKKISFSFKQNIKPKIVPVTPVPEKTVQFIECVEEKSIKVVGFEEKKGTELIIPMQPSTKRLHTELVQMKHNVNGKKLPENEGQTLDEIAVQAILSDCQQIKEDGVEDKRVIQVLKKVNPPEGSEMPTAEDYLNVPLSQYGLAMIRGMGWEPPTKGTNKSSQIDAASQPELRPKGMGLGADKLIKSVQKQQVNEEKLELKNGSYVQFVIGRLDGQYGQVMGFDEGDSRVIINIARINQMEKVNENTFRLVTKNDFDKNSKVLNIKKYKDYHEGKIKSNENDNQPKYHKKKNKDTNSDHYFRHHKTKKSKHSKSPHRKHKSDHNRHKKYKHKRSSS